MEKITYTFINCNTIIQVGPCHHGMAHPQVADGETPSNKEGSCDNNNNNNNNNNNKWRATDKG
jgi:hypothetical protein